MVEWIQRYKYQLAIAGISVLAAFMRLYQLTSLPPGLHPDEAANGLDVFRILEQHDWQPFYPTNKGREALFFYLQSIGVLIFGNTVLGLRIAPALIGTAATGAVYLWVSSWFGRRTGLIAALLMAVTPWAVTISRDGVRAGMVALMVPLTLWLYTKSFQTGRQRWFIWAGISLGLGFYTYIAYRLFPVALLAIVGFVLLWRRQWIKPWLGRLLASAVTAAIVLVPLGIYAVKHPANIAERPGSVSFTNPLLNYGYPFETLLVVIGKTALMFNFHGDENYRHNLGGQPELNIFVGVMFVLGLFLCVTQWRRLRYFAVLAVFGVMLLPAVLTAEGIPHALRAIGALPPTLAMAAFGIGYTLDQWRAVFPVNTAARALGSVAVGALLVWTVYQGYVQYFVAWAHSPQIYQAYSEDTAAVADYLNSHPFVGQRYVLGGWYQLMPVQYLTHHHATYQQVEPKEVDTIEAAAGQAKEFIVFEGDKTSVLKQLNARFPHSRISPHYSSFNGDELFLTYTVPAS